MVDLDIFCGFLIQNHKHVIPNIDATVENWYLLRLGLKELRAV